LKDPNKSYTTSAISSPKKVRSLQNTRTNMMDKISTKLTVLSLISSLGLAVAYQLGKHSASNDAFIQSNVTKKNGGKHSNYKNGKIIKAPSTSTCTHNSHEEENINNGDLNSSSNTITMQPIGKISSVYRLCVGTPRQGLLAPNSRGRIDLDPTMISHESVLDLDKFSHLWIVFVFHLNSISGKNRKDGQFPAKIKPPALGGKRVGIFATRTPHRPNPVGFTLCKIDRIVIPEKKKGVKAKNQKYSIYVSGLDLVDGTPVIDIKPYVPYYDSVEEFHVSEVRIPQWVSDGLDKRRLVSFLPEAEEQLTNIMTDAVTGSQMKFYGVSSGRDPTNEEGLKSIKSCIEEVLSVDVRSSYQTGKARKGKFQAEKAIRVSSLLSEEDKSSDVKEEKMCTQQLDSLLIKYLVVAHEQVETNSAVDTSGSGADDSIIVQKISFMPSKGETN